jgi:hypothetical protein
MEVGSDSPIPLLPRVLSLQFGLAGVKLRLSFAFRPQTDGQSEVANRVLGVYLRCLAGDRPRS